MFSMLRSIISLLVFLVVVYIVIFVPVGDKTLFQHGRAIFSSDEGKALVDGIKTKSKQLYERDIAKHLDVKNVKRSGNTAMDVPKQQLVDKGSSE